MITLSATIQTESQKAATWPFRLFEIEGAISTLRYCDQDKPVLYNGQVYSPRGIEYSQIRNNLSFELDTYKVNIDNHDDAITSWALNTDNRGYQTTVYKGFLDGTEDVSGNLLPLDSFALLLFSGKLIQIDVGAEAALRVKANIDMHQQIGPKATQNVTCRFRFKDPNCGYAGAETTCNLTYARCIELGNETRFGGFTNLNRKSKS